MRKGNVKAALSLTTFVSPSSKYGRAARLVDSGALSLLELGEQLRLHRASPGKSQIPIL
jgi:hypothetical protein